MSVSLDGPSEKSIPDFSETAQRRPTRELSRSLKIKINEGDRLRLGDCALKDSDAEGTVEARSEGRAGKDWPPNNCLLVLLVARSEAGRTNEDVPRGLPRSLKRNNIEGDCLAGALRVATRLVPAADEHFIVGRAFADSGDSALMASTFSRACTCSSHLESAWDNCRSSRPCRNFRRDLSFLQTHPLKVPRGLSNRWNQHPKIL